MCNRSAAALFLAGPLLISTLTTSGVPKGICKQYTTSRKSGIYYKKDKEACSSTLARLSLVDLASWFSQIPKYQCTSIA